MPNTASCLSSGTVRLLAAALLLGALARPATAGSESFRPTLAQAAREVKKVLDDRGQKSVSIGQFTGPATDGNQSFGPGIAKVLAEELGRLKVRIEVSAPLGAEGKYRVTRAPAPNPDAAILGQTIPVIHLQLSVISAEGEELKTIRRTVENGEDVAPPDYRLRGNAVWAVQQDGYGIEVLVDGKARMPHEVKNKATRKSHAFVELRRDETYSVRITNTSPYDAAVRLHIDGLSMFAFSDLVHEEGEQAGQPLHETLLVPRGKSVVIHGWFRNLGRTDSFKVTSYADSAVARQVALSSTGAKVGTITASFAACWKEGDPEPPGERSAVGTGFGPPREDIAYREAKRKIGKLRASVSVRYSK